MGLGGQAAEEGRVLGEGGSVLKQSGRDKPGVSQVSSVKQPSGHVLLLWWKDNEVWSCRHTGAGCAVFSALLQCGELQGGAVGPEGRRPVLGGLFVWDSSGCDMDGGGAKTGSSVEASGIWESHREMYVVRLIIS